MLKPIVDFPDYKISESGEVWSDKRNIFLEPRMKSNGYLQIGLWRRGKRIWKSIHRLVLETYIGSCPVGMETCHNNGVKTDNRLENLRWDTKSNNIKDAIKHGTHRSAKQNGADNLMAKLEARDVRMIIYMYRTGLFLQREIAKIYNITQSHISDIISRRKWQHLWKKA